MKQVINLSRKEAKARIKEIRHKNFFWVSIGEPGIPESKLQSDFHVDFWDITKDIPELDMFVMPPKIGERLFQALLKNRDKNIVVNCAAGVSRSGAVARFCEDAFGHSWEFNSKLRAHPNIHVYSMLWRLFLRHESKRVN